MAKTEEDIPKVIAAANARPNQVYAGGFAAPIQQGLPDGHADGSQRRVGQGSIYARAVAPQWQLEDSGPGSQVRAACSIGAFTANTPAGLMAELGSHQVDIADWAFQSEPVSVVGVGGLDYWKDGRDIFDNVSVIFEYPEGQKFVFTSICNNAHLDFSEVIMGDEGTIEITLGNNSAKAMLFRETKAKDAPTNKVKTADTKEQNWWAGATAANRGVRKGFPIFPESPKAGPGICRQGNGIREEVAHRHGRCGSGQGTRRPHRRRRSILRCIREGKEAHC